MADLIRPALNKYPRLALVRVAVSEEKHRLLTPYSVLTLAVPLVALAAVMSMDSLLALNYIHVLMGGTWTGIDLFMGIVMGRVMKGLEPPARIQVIKKLVPVMLFLMPSLATAAGTAAAGAAKADDVVDARHILDEAAITVQRVRDELKDSGDMDNLLQQSKGVLIVPSYYKASFILGGAYGDGVLLVRRPEGDFGDPAFYRMTAGSIGLQLGMNSAEIVFMILTEKGLSAVINDEFKIGVLGCAHFDRDRAFAPRDEKIVDSPSTIMPTTGFGEGATPMAVRGISG